MKPKIGIISSVPVNPFSNLDFDKLGFSEGEKNAALTKEIDLFLNTLDEEYRRLGLGFEIVRAMDGLPKHGEYDAYLLGGSPAMVTDRLEKPWIDSYIKFIEKEVNAGTPVLGMCFGHQVLAAAFGAEVGQMEDRKLGSSSIMLNVNGKGDEIFSKIEDQLVGLYSHRQAVLHPGTDIVTLGVAEHDQNTIIKVGDHARGVQFHPEFMGDTVAFLAKLMAPMLEQEGFSLQDILADAKSNANHTGAKTIQLFLKKYWNKI